MMGAAVSGLWIPHVRAQSEYPSKPVRMVVPYATGQSADIFGRMVALQLGEIWPRATVVDNRGGGAGIPGMLAGRDAEPDGHTFVLGGSGTMAINPGLYGDKLPYDPIKDFTAVHGLFLAPLIVLAHPDSGIETFQQLIERAKVKPGAEQWGVAGLGTSPYLAGEMIKSAAGVNITAVPYRGSGHMLNDLLGGQIKLGVDTVSASINYVTEGRLRALAVTSRERLPQLPDTPTVAELGYPDFEAVGWAGFFVPAKTSADHAAAIEAALRKAMSTKAMQDGITQRGALVDMRGGKEFGAFVNAELDKWGAIIAANEIKVNE